MGNKYYCKYIRMRKNQIRINVNFNWCEVAMDVRTVILMLAMGYFALGLLLSIFKYNIINSQKIHFWTPAKYLQAAGFFLLYFRTSIFDSVTIFSYILLILGCFYEALALRILSGKSASPKFYIPVSFGIPLVLPIINFLNEPYRIGFVFLIQSAFYFLPSVFLVKGTERKFSLRLLLNISYFTAGITFLVTSIICLAFPKLALAVYSNIINIISAIRFLIFLLGSFSLLMLAKERSDMELLEIQDNLKKTQSRYRQIIETAIEGIIIFDENYRITFANENMASILGYTIDEMIGKPYISFFPKSQLHIYHQQRCIRRKGEGSVYECCLLRKDGKTHWFLVSAKPILDESGKFDGSFAMLTDINDRKEMELLLAETNRQLVELSNKDSLTGIANRRLFDTTLEHEYLRLKRSNSKLSIILIDIDHFKEYNDYYGHVMGDECLRKIGKALEESINRSVDLAARYGGEEFACILPDTGLEGAVKVAERIKKNIENLKIEHKKSPVSEYVTASYGVATVKYSPEITIKDILKTADELLYRAKDLGRNRIEYKELE